MRLNSFFSFFPLWYSWDREGRKSALKKKSSKINRVRSFAFRLVIAGILLMYIGLLLKDYPFLMVLFMLLGLLSVMGSTLVYLRIGLLSVQAEQVICPSCGKRTKMLGRVDLCMFCGEALTLDPELEGKEFDESYNKRRPKKAGKNASERELEKSET
ncbi:Protein of unknown function (DUF2614) [Caldibacillus debilis GB1]|jgi:hypothetical protein|uniref:Uncharacterized protein n=1 Tax=Caldibacillus debilis GB1 TaxID=1339248 RepID=A0A420VCS6_9BACI|nr:hypothetical protein [Bacillaceae bacterium]RKO61431.1 Protein of unknown function (DUF2614) [Caldibacillus debilis GB1]